jgi:hypothetical protein
MFAPDGRDEAFGSQNSEMRNFPSNRPRYQGTKARRDEKTLPLFEIASVLVCFDIESMAQRRRWLQQLG